MAGDDGLMHFGGQSLGFADDADAPVVAQQPARPAAAATSPLAVNVKVFRSYATDSDKAGE